MPVSAAFGNTSSVGLGSRVADAMLVEGLLDGTEPAPVLPPTTQTPTPTKSATADPGDDDPGRRYAAPRAAKALDRRHIVAGQSERARRSAMKAPQVG